MQKYRSVNANFVRFGFYNSRKSQHYTFAVIVHQSKEILDIRRALQLEGKRGGVSEAHITLAELPKYEIDENNNKKGTRTSDKVKTPKKMEYVETVKKDKTEMREKAETSSRQETRLSRETG